MKYLVLSILSALTFIQLFAQNSNQPTMQEWQYPYEVHHITLSDSIDLAYIDEGKSNCVLLFVHGLGSNLKAWQKNIDYLKKDYRCIAIDLPGYGKSSKEDYPFTMTFFADIVRDFIDRKGLKKVVLIGHSMGGQIAIHTVLNKSKNIKKVILMATAGFETFSEQEKNWFQNFYTAAVVKATPKEQIVKNFHMNFHSFPNDAQFMIDDRLQMRESPEYQHYCNMIPQCVMGMLNEPVFDRLSEINLPTLVLFGENDMLIPNKFLHPDLTISEITKTGHERIPSSHLFMIPSAGHFVQWEQAALVNEFVSDFLK